MQKISVIDVPQPHHHHACRHHDDTREPSEAGLIRNSKILMFFVHRGFVFVIFLVIAVLIHSIRNHKQYEWNSIKDSDQHYGDDPSSRDGQGGHVPPRRRVLRVQVQRTTHGRRKLLLHLVLPLLCNVHCKSELRGRRSRHVVWPPLDCSHGQPRFSHSFEASPSWNRVSI